MLSREEMFDAISFTAPAVWLTLWLCPDICLCMLSMLARISVIALAVSCVL